MTEVSAGSDDSTTRFLLKSVRFSSKVMKRLFHVVGQLKVTTNSVLPLVSTGWLGIVGRPEVVGKGGAGAFGGQQCTGGVCCNVGCCNESWLHIAAA